MLSVTIVLFRPNPDDFRRTVETLVDNAEALSSVHILVSGTLAEYSAIKSLTAVLARATSCFLLHRFDNLGFASGHNLLLDEAFSNGADAAVVLNPDVVLESGALKELAAVSKLHGQRPLLFGPTLRRTAVDGPASPTFDSAGIGWTLSGRHYDIAQGDRWDIQSGHVENVSGVTGACLVIPRAVFCRIRDKSGYFFDDLFLAYREDAELGVRAAKLGIDSVVIHMEGFAHVRSVRGYQRGNKLADLLGVRNRFLLRWSLGHFRPGNRVIGTARDALVVMACFLVERSSLPGLRGAFAIRRYATYRGRYWRSLAVHN